MTLRFRNVDAHPSDLVERWPTEAIRTALERGSLTHWRRLVRAVRREPWGGTARRLEAALQSSRPYGVAPLLSSVLQRARADAERSERDEVARRVRGHLERFGGDRATFAESIGTSTSRLSTYLTGRVAPASTLLVRMERVADRAYETRGSRRPRDENARPPSA